MHATIFTFPPRLTEGGSLGTGVESKTLVIVSARSPSIGAHPPNTSF